MDRTLRFSILALLAAVALVAIAAMATADPADVTNPPTEDWVFDAGSTTTIRGQVWTLSYNITVTAGSTLKLDGCTFTIDGMSDFDPVFIRSDYNSTLELTSSEFIAANGSYGFYVEVHDNVTITDCEFRGLVENPSGDAGITVIGDEYMTAKVDFVTIYDTFQGDAMWFQNVQVDMSNCEIYDIRGSGVTYYLEDTVFERWYNITIIDTNIYNCGSDGMGIVGVNHDGIIGADIYNVEIWNISDDGLYLLLGGASGDDGNGSMFANFDRVDVRDIGDMGFYISTIYTVTGTSANWSNVFNVTVTNSTFTDIENTGFYVQLYFSTVDFSLVIDNTDFANISLDSSYSRPGGIFWWFYQSQGSASLYIEDSTFKRCEPAAIVAEDYGGTEIRVVDTEFSQMGEDATACFRFNVKSSYGQSVSSFENCTFFNSGTTGIQTYLESSATGTPVHVANCTFHNLSYSALSAEGSSYSDGHGFNITNTVIRDIGANAVYLYGYYLEGSMSLHIHNSTIQRTSGVRVDLGQDYVNTGGSMSLYIYNTTIEETFGTAVTLYGAAYYSPDRATLVFVNSTVDGALGDGISFRTDITGTSTSYHPRWDTSVTILNSMVNDVGGIGISLLSAESSTFGNPGTHTFVMNDTEIIGGQRGFFATGYSGRMNRCGISGTLKEDVICIDGRVDLYYCDFQLITDRKFKAVEGGEMHFFYTMDIYVKWDTGAAAIGATVQVFDNKGTLIAVLPVERNDGHLPTFLMEPFYVRETGIFSDTPYVINVTFLEVTKTLGVKLDSNKVVDIILLDHINPEIYILYPKEGHIQQSTLLHVRGAAWDSQSGIKQVWVTLDGDTWWKATGSLRWNITIDVNSTLISKFGGLFLLRAKAYDNALNERVAFVMVRIDPTPPELNVDFPPNNYVTNNPELWVRGVTELGSTVEINSVPVAVTVSMFTHKVNLVEGPNTISIISIDPLGNIQIERLTVYLDTQEPYIILTSPEEDSATSNQNTITIKATVEEDLYITVNGRHVVYGSDDYKEGTGIMTFNLTLEAGENVVVIQARDEADNLATIDFVVTYDTTPPWIQVISPTNGAVLPRPEVTVVGTIDPQATLTIEGESVTVTNGFFEIVILAFEGENTLHLEAEDAAGNVYSEDLVFTVDTQDPTLTITTPSEDAVTTNEVRYVIEGTTGAEIGGTWTVTATTVLVNGHPYTEVYDEEAGEALPVTIKVDSEGNFQIPVDLLEGRNEFTIEAWDAVGNRASQTITIRLDTVAPTLVMYIDPVYIDDEELFSHSYTVNITGYTDPGSQLFINDIPLPVNADGEFNTGYDLAKVTTIELRSMDSADNERVVKQVITYKPYPQGSGGDGGMDTDLIILIVAFVLLVVVVIGMTLFVRGRRDEMLEMEAAEATPLAPVEETLLEEPDELPGPEELEVEAEDEPAPTTAPARPRPRSPQARRAAAPRPVPKEGVPELEDKDLSEKDAEADIGADETDQEGI